MSTALVLSDCAVQVNARDNVAVTEVMLASPCATVGTPTSITAKLHNFGDQTHSISAVTLWVDGTPRGTQPLEVAARSTASVTFTLCRDLGALFCSVCSPLSSAFCCRLANACCGCDSSPG